MATNENTPIIRRLLERDIKPLHEFYNRYHSSRPRLLDTDIWRWEFMNNPNASEELPFFIIEAEGKIQGGIGYIPFRLQIGGRAINACHPVNYFVNPKYKGLPALRLLRAVLNEYPITIGSYVSDDAAKLLKAAGFIDLSKHLTSYYLPLRRRKSTSTRHISVDAVKSAMTQAMRRSWNMAIQFSCKLSLRNHVTYRISTVLDNSLLPMAEHLPAEQNGIVKNVPYLRWRYEQSPALNCVFICQLYNAVPYALAVVHTDRAEGRAIIMDIISPSTSINQLVCLLSHVINFCRKTNFHILSSVVLDVKIQKALYSLGFGHSQSEFRLMVHAKDKEIRNSLSDHRKWSFIIGDTDRY